MPKTKGQGLVFGILMSVTMAYGMEVYNVALKSGVLQHVGGRLQRYAQYRVFRCAEGSVLYVALCVFVF